MVKVRVVGLDAEEEAVERCALETGHREQRVMQARQAARMILADLRRAENAMLMLAEAMLKRGLRKKRRFSIGSRVRGGRLRATTRPPVTTPRATRTCPGTTPPTTASSTTRRTARSITTRTASAAPAQVTVLITVERDGPLTLGEIADMLADVRRETGPCDLLPVPTSLE